MGEAGSQQLYLALFKIQACEHSEVDAKAEAELENLLGIKQAKNYHPERPILQGDIKAQAGHDALELRRWLGLGDAPITDIVTLLEMEMDVRVYIRCVNSRISGLFAFDLMTNSGHASS